MERAGPLQPGTEHAPRPAALNPELHEHPEDNWVWSPQGVVDMHRPEKWGEVIFEGGTQSLLP